MSELKEYIAELKMAYEFYAELPDGQYDLFVAEMLNLEYFRLTGEDLAHED